MKLGASFREPAASSPQVRLTGHQPLLQEGYINQQIRRLSEATRAAAEGNVI